jgi:hypothetical protein
LRKLREWWSNLPLRIAALFMLSSLPFLMLYLCSPDLPWITAWAPNLACSLFTTGLAVYFINVMIVRREHEERDAKIAPVAHVVMLLVQPHVQGLLKELVDPSMRLGPVGGNPETWTNLSASVTHNIETYGGVLDADVMVPFDRIRNCLTHLGRRHSIVPDSKTGALEVYMLVAPIVVNCEKIRRRFFPKGDELLYGEMLPLLQQFKTQHGLPDESTFA